LGWSLCTPCYLGGLTLNFTVPERPPAVSVRANYQPASLYNAPRDCRRAARKRVRAHWRWICKAERLDGTP